MSTALNARIFSSFGRYLKPGQDWESMMAARLKWNEEHPWSELSHWEDKIAMKKKFKEARVPTVPSRYERYQPFNPADLAIAIKKAAKDRPVVAKPSHMTSGAYVFIVSGNDITIPSPTGPGSEAMRRRIDKWRQRRRRIGFHDVVRGLGDAMEKDAGDHRARALRESNKGVIVEDFLPHDAEVRILTIGGKALLGATDNNWVMVRKCPQTPEFKHSWEKVGDSDEDDWIAKEGHWHQMANWAETVAAETDLLRLDFFVSRSGGCVASEMCTFLRPQSQFFQGFYPALAKNLLAHHNVTRWSVNERFA